MVKNKCDKNIDYKHVYNPSAPLTRQVEYLANLSPPRTKVVSFNLPPTHIETNRVHYEEYIKDGKSLVLN